ncbi:pentatricopeptide repeat-containing protein-like [Iris pallida]|uniref:Pentatricopeptide repeat-containing protein-like n=1 Tax=Iris pallida TaxID=29817 RepID=A0AAX6EGD4_IRIPA|nr:pentatricopeptide repeat-containing protein-like [Iris pallida]
MLTRRKELRRRGVGWPWAGQNRVSRIWTEGSSRSGAELLQHHCNSLPHLKQIHALLLRTHHHHLLPIFNCAIRVLFKSNPLSSLRLYLLMTRLSVSPDNFTYPFLLNCSSSPLSPLFVGQELHSRLCKSGFRHHLPVANALIHFYSKCASDADSIPLARLAYDEMPLKDVVSHNSLLGTHARLGQRMHDARALFSGLREKNVITWNAMLLGYANAGDLASAREAFDLMPERDAVSWTVMVVGYSKCGLVDAAKELFCRMPSRNMVCWSVMVNGYSQAGRPEESLALFREMESVGIVPDAASMVGVISAASQIGRPELANWIGDYVDRKGIERNERVLTTLVDMHAKCGNVEEAFSLFNEMPSRDTFAYTALIGGLASNGHGAKVLELFSRMREEGIEPDHVTFVGVLSACSHAGLVDEGLEFWESMIQDYGIEHGADHYACIIDMLGRVGRLEEAYEMVKKMPMGPHAGALGALLAACKTYGNVDIANNVASRLFELEPGNTGNFVLLSSIYASREQWEDAARVRKMMKERGPTKLPGSSWIENDMQRGHRSQKIDQTTYIL